MIELTQEQQQAIRNGEPVRISHPELGREVVLLSAETYEEIRELLEDERRQKAFRQAGMKSASRWMKDNPY